MEGQDAVIAFLREPAAYGAGATRVDVIETHISIVFLAGERAYKLKRAVKYPYLDFSTPERRRAMCEAELRLNRRTAPDLYLEVRAVTRRTDGAIGWGPEGTPLDWVLVMRRFDERRLLDRVAREGGLDAGVLRALAARIARFHEAAEIRTDGGGAAAMAEVVRSNLGVLRGTAAAVFAAEQIEKLTARAEAEAARLAPLLDRRRDAGKVRRCHGDLHLRNIFLGDDGPVLFDCIEFSDEIATIDVLYDLAFLLMDLAHRGHADLAGVVLNRYLDLGDDEEGLAAMPLFLAMRAVIRAHVTATALDRGWAEAGADAEIRQYLAEAEAALAPAPPRLVAVGGLSGSGKSTLAAALAPQLGPPPGARILRSDVLRKRLFGVDPEEKLPPAAYTSEASRRVYAELRRRAEAGLAAGASVIIDAVALRPEERRDFAALAARAGVPFAGLWLDAPRATMTARIEGRRGDASDASLQVLAEQLTRDVGPLGDWIRIDASGGIAATVAAARRALGLG
jgi:aminoglycoside phosphotransferase family enzyme/predicted kinase